MSEYRIIKPTGLYLPLVWNDKAENLGFFSIRLFVFANIMLRFLVYPFSFIFNLIMTVSSIILATCFNLGCLLGGYFSAYWSHHTKKYNQIAIIRCEWLLADSLVFICLQLKLFLGLIHSEFGMTSLVMLKEILDELDNIDLFNFDWQLGHTNMIKRLKSYLDNHDLRTARAIICSLGAEPAEVIYFALKMAWGMGSDFHPYGLNPKQLTQEQASRQPVLLLHGNLHNQSAWLPLAALLHSRQYSGPVFTVNLSQNAITLKDREIVDSKFREIKLLYEEQGKTEVKFNLIGHSRGALFAYKRRFFPESLPKSRNIIEEAVGFNNVILIGHESQPGYNYENNHCFFINGRHDVLQLPEQNTQEFIVNSGHIGVLADPDALDECCRILEETTSI